MRTELDLSGPKARDHHGGIGEKMAFGSSSLHSSMNLGRVRDRIGLLLGLGIKLELSITLTLTLTNQGFHKKNPFQKPFKNTFLNNSGTYSGPYGDSSGLPSGAKTQDYYNHGKLQQTGNVSQLIGTGGLKVGKFGPGFSRRNEKNIENVFTEHFYQYSIGEGQHKRDVLNETRSETLRTADSKYNYDLISGASRRYDVKNSIELKNIGKKQVGDGLGFEASKRGNAVLRDSVGRFFTPQPGGSKQHNRQSNIVNEGLLRPKTTSILKLPDYYLEEGRRSHGVMHSYGVEEQFSKSNYAPKSEIASTGLAESCRPGLYTPRLQPNNPSGYPEITQNWAKGVDFNCTTTIQRRRDRAVRPETEHRPSTGILREDSYQRPATSNYY